MNFRYRFRIIYDNLGRKAKLKKLEEMKLALNVNSDRLPRLFLAAKTSSEPVIKNKFMLETYEKKLAEVFNIKVEEIHVQASAA